MVEMLHCARGPRLQLHPANLRAGTSARLGIWAPSCSDGMELALLLVCLPQDALKSFVIFLLSLLFLAIVPGSIIPRLLT